MGATVTHHVDLRNKCGTCGNATTHPTRTSCIICTARYSMPPYAQSILIRSHRRCPNYIFDPTKLCPCGEFPEPWYIFCPRCGRRLKEEAKT